MPVHETGGRSRNVLGDLITFDVDAVLARAVACVSTEVRSAEGGRMGLLALVGGGAGPLAEFLGGLSRGKPLSRAVDGRCRASSRTVGGTRCESEARVRQENRPMPGGPLMSRIPLLAAALAVSPALSFAQLPSCSLPIRPPTARRSTLVWKGDRETVKTPEVVYAGVAAGEEVEFLMKFDVPKSANRDGLALVMLDSAPVAVANTGP
jgi:hypothetical protein